jgi:integrase
MKKSIPNYRKTGFSHIKLKPKDKKILNNYMVFVNGSACDKRAKNIKSIMLMIYDVSEVGFDKWDINTLRQFLEVLNKTKKPNSTTNDIKKNLKRFLKENYSDWNKRFKGFKDHSIKQKPELNQEKINKSVLITPEELDLLLRDKKTDYLLSAYISAGMETAGRPSELLRTKWKDWDLENKSVKIFSTKNNKIRILPINECIYYLKQHKQNYPFADVTEEDFVFPSPLDRKKPLGLTSIYNYFTRITQRKLKRKLKPYILRHTRLSFLHKKLSPKSYENFADHSYEVAISTYAHLDDEDLKEEMYDKVFKRKELTPEEKNKIEELEKQIEQLQKAFKIIYESITKKKIISFEGDLLKVTKKS